jgi:hypothetical protein
MLGCDSNDFRAFGKNIGFETILFLGLPMSFGL